MLKGSIIDRCCCYDNLVPSDTWHGALVEIGLAVNVLRQICRFVITEQWCCQFRHLSLHV